MKLLRERNTDREGFWKRCRFKGKEEIMQVASAMAVLCYSVYYTWWLTQLFGELATAFDSPFGVYKTWWCHTTLFSTPISRIGYKRLCFCRRTDKKFNRTAAAQPKTINFFFFSKEFSTRLWQERSALFPERLEDSTDEKPAQKKKNHFPLEKPFG